MHTSLLAPSCPGPAAIAVAAWAAAWTLLTDSGAALLVREGDSPAQQIASHLTNMLDNPSQLSEMASLARSNALLGAAEKLADMVEQET